MQEIEKVSEAIKKVIGVNLNIDLVISSDYNIELHIKNFLFWSKNWLEFRE